IGITRIDVAALHPNYPNNNASGFAFAGDLSAEFKDGAASRRRVKIVAIAGGGRETVLASFHLISPQALSRWSRLLDKNPALAARKTTFLMMTSGMHVGGADEINTAYLPFFTRTTRVGFSVPILYMRTTKGAAGDWIFDPEWDVKRKCGER